jgi:hypothetical protein
VNCVNHLVGLDLRHGELQAQQLSNAILALTTKGLKTSEDVWIERDGGNNSFAARFVDYADSHNFSRLRIQGTCVAFDVRPGGVMGELEGYGLCEAFECLIDLQPHLLEIKALNNTKVDHWCLKTYTRIFNSLAWAVEYGIEVGDACRTHLD